MLFLGGTLFENFEIRLKNELEALAPDRVINVVAPPDRHFSTWIGGSILASLEVFDDLLITKAQYDNYGPKIVEFKCRKLTKLIFVFCF